MELFFLIVLKSKISCSSWLMRKVKNKSLVLWNMIFPRAHPEYPRLLLWNLKLTNNFPNRQESDQHLISKRLSWVGAGKNLASWAHLSLCSWNFEGSWWGRLLWSPCGFCMFPICWKNDCDSKALISHFSFSLKSELKLALLPSNFEMGFCTGLHGV